MHALRSDHTRRQLELMSKALEQAAEINRALLAQMADEAEGRNETGETDGIHGSAAGARAGD